MTDAARILLVDDEKEFTETIGKILNLNSYDVEKALSGSEAIKIYEAGKFDLIVTDLNMPGMDGIELIRRVRKLNPAQNIIVVTGFPSHESQEEAFKLGTLNYVVKPFTVNRFIEIVKKALEGKGDEEILTGPVELTIEDLTQMYALQGKSVVVEIITSKDTGYIYLENGDVVHAETNRNKGEEAFYEIQSWKGGRFNAKPLEDRIPRTIKSRVDALLLEGARRQDESSKKQYMKSKATQNAKKKKENNSLPEIEKILKETVAALEGFISCSIADMGAKRIVSINSHNPPSDELLATFAITINSVRDVVAETEVGNLEESRFESDRTLFINKFIGKGKYFLCVAVSRDSVLGEVKMVVKQTAAKLAEILH